MIHRDVKPANCLLRLRDQRVKLADLGIAVEHATQVGERAGTLPFMAPELFGERPRYGPRTDLYALGVTLACVALSADPFPRGSSGEMMAWIQNGKRPDLAAARPDLPGPLVGLIERLWARSEDARPASAGAALAALLDRAPDVRGAPGAPADQPRIGPWVPGAQVYDSPNWRAWAATHATTGAPARFCHVQPFAHVLDAGSLILESAARASRFDYPGLIAILDWGMHESRPYVVTAPQGRSLLELVESAPCDEVDALLLTADVADAVAYLHERGLVYQVVEPGAAFIRPAARSIKPSTSTASARSSISSLPVSRRSAATRWSRSCWPRRRRPPRCATSLRQ